MKDKTATINLMNEEQEVDVMDIIDTELCGKGEEIKTEKLEDSGEVSDNIESIEDEDLINAQKEAEDKDGLQEVSDATDAIDDTMDWDIAQ